MDLTSGLLLIGGAVGAGVAIYGLRMLVTGHATRGDQRALRRTDGARYYLCFGLALALLALASVLNRHHQTVPAIATVVVAMVLIGLAVIRYRPRQSRRR